VTGRRRDRLKQWHVLVLERRASPREVRKALWPELRPGLGPREAGGGPLRGGTRQQLTAELRARPGRRRPGVAAVVVVVAAVRNGRRGDSLPKRVIEHAQRGLSPRDLRQVPVLAVAALKHLLRNRRNKRRVLALHEGIRPGEVGHLLRTARAQVF